MCKHMTESMGGDTVDDLMHLKDMAAFLGISEWAVRQEIKAQRLRAKKTGKGWTSLRHVVEDFREEFYGGKQ